MSKHAAKGRKKSAKHKRKHKSLASRADRHSLYEQAVQDTDRDVRLMTWVFKQIRGYTPMRLREDFCGTAALCLSWVQSNPGREALGVDLCGDTMAWGKHKRIDPAGEEHAKRIVLHRDDVRAPAPGGFKADLCTALNFSYNVFKTRADLLAYFTAVHQGLDRDGVFLIDLLGGSETMGEEFTDHDHGDFVYRWEQSRFNIIDHAITCHIHFLFPDDSIVENAFTYDWRLWTIPELRELMLEAGFSKVHFYWEKTDEDGDGTGEFYEPSYVENQEVWWTYMAAER